MKPDLLPTDAPVSPSTELSVLVLLNLLFGPLNFVLLLLNLNLKRLCCPRYLKECGSLIWAFLSDCSILPCPGAASCLREYGADPLSEVLV